MAHDGASDLNQYPLLPPQERQSLIRPFPEHPPLSRSDLLSRRLSRAALVFTFIIGIACILSGISLIAVYTRKSSTLTQGDPFEGFLYLNLSPRWSEATNLFLSIVVTVCTEAVGYVHGIALRSSLIEERRLYFNTNARLFTATRRRRWAGPNGVPCNILMMVLLIMSFASATTTFQPSSPFLVVSVAPMITLGVCLVLQVSIAMFALRTTRILTWNTTALGTLLVLSHCSRVRHFSGHSMCSVTHIGHNPHPQYPSSRQPTVWQARKDVRAVIFLIPFEDVPVTRIYPLPSSPSAAWLALFGLLFAVQGFLAVTLHQAGVVASSMWDEQVWRSAGGRKGTAMEPNILAPIVAPINLILMLSKPALHFMMSRANSITIVSSDSTSSSRRIAIYFNGDQYTILATIILLLTLLLNYLMLRPPRGPQPAAYGHFQTLANLIDVWPADGQDSMYWGHKGDHQGVDGRGMEGDVGGKYCRAGTGGAISEDAERSNRKIEKVATQRDAARRSEDAVNNLAGIGSIHIVATSIDR
ncbi:hypothetical protein CONPUDRAFT_152606 [Coniophora puteana RWD-64-598 SS2]|uniref:Uncharacterized protein n=1 Tax=Coniophora puteana (strain RWD-64-598) TaxID=741705 RepID=A0A5M3MR92_CONPW|nr:uncharacterized protein CONPUDRAFT_152606 [Coniophora puteana RWD-64-598 SS2]EIW81688.1 hypothetical protein CONPUDRAFT_152606 [Coniophora puteana RWD-64-598 SS2]